MAHHSVLLTPSVPSVEGALARWDDLSVPFDVDGGSRHLGQVDQTGADPRKADDVQQVDKASHSPILQPTPDGPSPISGSPSASIHDSVSMHSLTAAAVQVTESRHSPSLPQAPDIPSLNDNDGTTPVQRIVGSSTSTPLTSRRSVRSRSVMDVRHWCCDLF